MPTTPKPTAARQQRRRHRGRRCVSGRNGAWVGPRAKRKACFPLAAPTLGRGRDVIQTLFQSGKPGYRRVGASAYATQRARVPQRFGGGQMFQPPLKVFLRERSAVGCVTLLMGCPRLRCRLAARPPRIMARPPDTAPPRTSATPAAGCGGIAASHGSPHPRIESGGGKAPPHAAYVPACRPAKVPSPRRFTSAPLMSGSSKNTRVANDFPCRRGAAWSRVHPRGWHATASESCSRIQVCKVLIREQDW